MYKLKWYVSQKMGRGQYFVCLNVESMIERDPDVAVVDIGLYTHQRELLTPCQLYFIDKANSLKSAGRSVSILGTTLLYAVTVTLQNHRQNQRDLCWLSFKIVHFNKPSDFY